MRIWPIEQRYLARSKGADLNPTSLNFTLRVSWFVVPPKCLYSVGSLMFTVYIDYKLKLKPTVSDSPKPAMTKLRTGPIFIL